MLNQKLKFRIPMYKFKTTFLNDYKKDNFSDSIKYVIQIKFSKRGQYFYQNHISIRILLINILYKTINIYVCIIDIV